MSTGTVSLLLDCTCGMTFAAADLGGGESFAGGGSFNADKVTVKESVSTADHSTAQNLLEIHRITKRTFEVTVETKFYNPTMLANLRTNALGQLTVTSAQTGTSLVASGIITDIDVDYAGPSTMRFSLKCHGTALAYS